MEAGCEQCRCLLQQYKAMVASLAASSDALAAELIQDAGGEGFTHAWQEALTAKLNCENLRGHIREHLTEHAGAVEGKSSAA